MLHSSAAGRLAQAAAGSLGLRAPWLATAQAHPQRPQRLAPAASTAAQERGLAAAAAAGAQQQQAAAHSMSGGGADGGTSTWEGAGLTQEELMAKDECILVDEEDRVTGHASKYASHRFEGGTPRGLLHRAFSVFLFDSSNRLLLQQRAASKITFPKVWTNTCCSHPLHGYSPTEVDSAADVAAGAAPGAARAAARKLLHELGIPPSLLPPERFKFLTRLHYCAADEGTYGAGAPWGEHEMDYILCVRADVPLAPNPEEVMDTRYVTLEELRAMMAPGSGLLWSPWFRIIAENFLERWWADLDATLTTDAHVDGASIHRITT